MKLTVFAKILIAIAILGFLGAAFWQFGLRDMMTGDKGSTSTSSSADGSQVAADAAAEKKGSGFKLPFGNSEPKGPLGSDGNPLKVSIVSFHGYAPALVAAGNSLTTRPGSIFANKGVNVEFVIQDDIPTLSTVFESGAAHCAWRTSDFWAQEQPNLRNAGLDAKAVMVVDNTQGADAVIASDPAIQRIEDLPGKSVALLQYTPSHGMLIDAIDNSSLTARAKQSIRMVYINPDEGTAGVRAAMEGGSVDAAVLWDPDLSLAVKNVRGAHVIYSTKTATNLIYDVMVCNQKVLDDPASQNAMQGFVAGWMAGVDAAEADPANAVSALIETEEFFRLLAQDEGRDFIRTLFDNLVWTGLEDNARILGFAGGTNHYERVYQRFDGIYRGAGALANPNSPVIPAQQSFDYRYIKALIDADAAAQAAARQPEFTFTTSGRDAAAGSAAVVTKPVSVGFATGKTTLNKRAQRTIDQEMVPFIEGNGSAYFIVSGNTDSTGSRDVNMRISRARAESVVDYLLNEWEFDRSRFTVRGDGPDQPICDERNPAAENLDLDSCRALNRSTRVAVLSR